MGTRSRIGVMHGDKVKSVYCHWDGYLEHNGRMLQEHYDSSKANHLVALGDLSSLGPNIGEKHSFDIEAKYGTPEYLAEAEHKATMCTFYGRDRGESGTEFQVSHSFAEFLEQCDNCGAEYYYINKDGVWYVGTTYENTHSLSKALVALTEALMAEEATA
jgi:hypothetical protein